EQEREVSGGDGFGFAENFFWCEAAQLGEIQVANGVFNSGVDGGVRKQEREVATHGLVAGKLAGDGLAQRLAIEAVKIDFADIDRLLELAALGFGGMQLAEVCNTAAVEHGACTAA